MKTAVATDDEPYPPFEGWCIEMWDERKERWVTSAASRDWDEVLGRLNGYVSENPTKRYRVLREFTTYTVEIPPTGAVPDEAEPE